MLIMKYIVKGIIDYCILLVTIVFIVCLFVVGLYGDDKIFLTIVILPFVLLCTLGSIHAMGIFMEIEDEESWTIRKEVIKT